MTTDKERGIEVFRDVRYAGFFRSLFCTHEWWCKYGELGAGWREYKCAKCGRTHYEDDLYW